MATATSSTTSTPDNDISDIKPTWMGRNRPFFMYGIPLVLLIIGIVLYLQGGRYVSTDDAYVSAARVAISPSISGRVTDILVHDNQQVKKGDVLFKIDNRPYVIAVEQAEADLAKARQQVGSTKADYQQKLATVRSAQDSLAYQTREYDRQKKLAAVGLASTAQLDQALHNLQTAQAQITAEQQGAETVLANLGGQANLARDEDPAVKAAIAALDRAKLNLTYTVVTAPIDGVVTKVESLQIGSYINASAAVFSLVSNHDIWVEANFKETDLTHMRVGQTASVTVDTFSGKALKGTVESISPGTGSSFSLLPPENSTGNWVKVVQRLPVRITIQNPDQLQLADGLSVQAEVDTQHHRSLSGVL